MKAVFGNPRQVTVILELRGDPMNNQRAWDYINPDYIDWVEDLDKYANHGMCMSDDEDVIDID